MAATRPSSESAPPRNHTVRQVKVVLDVDLANLYGVPTMRWNEVVKPLLDAPAVKQAMKPKIGFHPGNR